MLNGEGRVDVLSDDGGVDHVPGERGASIADVDVHRGGLRAVGSGRLALSAVDGARARVPVGVTEPADEYAKVTTWPPTHSHAEEKSLQDSNMSCSQ